MALGNLRLKTGAGNAFLREIRMPHKELLGNKLEESKSTVPLLTGQRDGEAILARMTYSLQISHANHITDHCSGLLPVM